MENYIKTYDNVISADLCSQLIAMFEENPQHQRQTVFEDHMSFTEVNLQHHKEWTPFTNYLASIFRSHITKYIEDCNIEDKMFPQQFAWEQFRMKRYLPDGVDQFDNHVDVGDMHSARRYLVFFLYLDDNEGGHTDFPQYDISVKPEKGRLVMFPPMWTHLHAGRKPIDKPKYIIGSYLHYV